METLKSDISEAYKVHVDYLKIQSLILKMIWKTKWMTWLGFTRQCKKNLATASYSEQIQILTLESDKRSRMYSSEYFNVFEYLVWTSLEIKKVGGILAKPANISKTLHLVTNVYEDDNFSR